MTKKSILLFAFGFLVILSVPIWAQAEYEKTEKIGKLVAEYMPEGISLKWDDPEGFEKVLVVKNKYRLPQNSKDGQVIYEGKEKTYLDKDLRPGETYYYGIFFIEKKKLINLPVVNNTIELSEELYQKIPAPAKAGVVSVSAGTQIIFLLGMFDSAKDFWFSLLRIFNVLVVVFSMRSHKKKHWGLVYNSKTKEPIKNILVNLRNEREELAATAITDEAGRFGFLVEEGNYILEVKGSAQYQFNPVLIKDKENEEDIYGKPYKGETLKIKKEELLKVNIPLTPISNADMENEKRLKIKKFDFSKLKSNRLLGFIVDFSFWVGFIFALFSVAFNYSVFKLFLVIFYIIVFLIRFYLLNLIKEWGVVLLGSNKTPVPFAVVRAFKASQGGNKEQVGVAVSNMKGGFYLLLPPDNYKLSIKGRTLEGNNFNKEALINAEKGLVNGVYFV